MNAKTYWRVALLLPMVAPVPFAALAALGVELAWLPLMFLGGALLYAGVPYVIFAAAVLLWSRRHTADELARLARWSPLLFAPLAALGTGAFFWGGVERWGWGYFASNAAGGAVSAVLFGYLYFGLAQAGRHAFVRDEQPLDPGGTAITAGGGA